MSKLQSELQLLWRYACAGGLNAVVGLGSIFALMGVGLPPVIANVIGYLLSLTLAFFVAKTFVFRSGNHLAPESLRYLLAFGFSFLCNLAVLYVSLNLLKWHSGVAQISSISTYVIVMFFMSRFFVFSNANDKGNKEH